MTWNPKKSIEYVGKVEKAIADKYGEEAVTNPRSLWDEEKENDYIKQAEENAEKYYKKDEDDDIVEKEGIFVSKKLLNKSNTDKCTICNKYMLSSRDKVYLLKWECCNGCYIKWVEDREDRWNNGWRPNKEK
jgi:hypothetical protein